MRQYILDIRNIDFNILKMSNETDNHFKNLNLLAVPAKRAAYSDRMAWMMALLSSIVYQRFDEEADDFIMKAAQDLAALNSEGDIQELLRELARNLTSADQQTGNKDNTALKAALAAGRFTLVGGAPVHIPATDTQAMVVVREATRQEPPFAVLVFRGTREARDWTTNFKAGLTPVADPKKRADIVGNMHTGFHNAFKSAESEIRRRLDGEEVKDLPLYITGHSLGGALAVVATWYLDSQRLAACYTFGAPRVGDTGLLGWFKSPIYRIVNYADPVPFMPPSGLVINLGKRLLRGLATLLPFFGIVDRILGWLIKIQGYRHYGDMKYLPNARPVHGKYPENFRIQPAVSSLERLSRYLKVFIEDRVNKTPGKAGASLDRIDRYHGMARYREKLRAVALNRNQ